MPNLPEPQSAGKCPVCGSKDTGIEEVLNARTRKQYFVCYDCNHQEDYNGHSA